MKNKFLDILNRYPLAAVFAFTFICLFPAMLFRDFTPSNELRYLSIADEAIANGNIFAFTNHGIPYADKPPLYFWIVMLCRIIFGHHSCFALSMFSLVPAFVIVWVMDKWVMSKASVQDRMAAAIMLLTSVMFLGTMVVLRMDMLMCMFIVLAMHTFYRMYMSESPSGRDSILFPVWIFMALFTKGPVGLMVPPLSVLVFLIVKRKWRDIGKYLGWKTWSIIAGLFLVWILCAFADGGKAYIDNLLFKQTVGRAVNAFTHNKPFWFYFIAILWCVAPYCLLLTGSFVMSVWPSSRKSQAKGNRCEYIDGGEVKSDIEILFVCVITTTFIMLSSFSSKLPVYLCPIFPFLVYLFPVVLERNGGRKWMKCAIGIPAGILSVAGLVVLVALSGCVHIEALDEILLRYPFVKSMLVKFAALLLMAGNAFAIWMLVKRDAWNLPVFMMGCSLLLMIYSASGVMDRINPYFGYSAVCETVPEDTEVMTLFVHRPENMDVYLGRQVVDYKKDVAAFMSSFEEREDDPAPMSLIIMSDKMDEYPELQRFVQECGTCVYVGPYCVATYRAK